LKRQFRPKNPLTRHTERHAQFTTLFRAHDSSAPRETTDSNTSRLSAPSQPISYAPDGLPIMRAMWIEQNSASTPNVQAPAVQRNFPVETAAPDLAAPATTLNAPMALPSEGAADNSVAPNSEAQNVEAQNVEARNVEAQNVDLPTVDVPTVETSDPIQLKSETHVQGAAQTNTSLSDISEPRQSRAVPPQTSQPSNPPTPSSPPSPVDAGWSRLQNIMRHHEAKTEAESLATETSNPAAATGNSHSGSTPIQRQRDTRAARLNRLQGVPSAPSESLSTPSAPPRPSQQNVQPASVEPSADDVSALKNSAVEPLPSVQLDPATEPPDDSINKPANRIDPDAAAKSNKLPNGPDPRPVDPQSVQKRSVSDPVQTKPEAGITPIPDSGQTKPEVGAVKNDGAPSSSLPNEPVTDTHEMVQTQPDAGTTRDDGAVEPPSVTDAFVDAATDDGKADTDLLAGALSEAALGAEQSETLSDSKAAPPISTDTLADQSSEQADVQRTTDTSTDPSIPASELDVSPSFETDPEAAAIAPTLGQETTSTPSAPSSEASQQSASIPSATSSGVDQEASTVSQIESEKLSPVDNAPKISSPAASSSSSGASLEQSGWAIQRTEAGSDSSGHYADLSESPPLSVDKTTTNASQIQRALDDVLPAQSTDSSVELVVPRRSREAILSSMQQNVPNASDANVTDAQASDAKASDAKATDANAPNTSPETAVIQQASLETANPPMAPTVNDSKSGTEAQPEVAEPELIDTEIGALPSDLWEQIDQVPPRASDLPTTQSKAMSEQNDPVAASDKSPPENISTTTSDNSPSSNSSSGNNPVDNSTLDNNTPDTALDSIVQRTTHDTPFSDQSPSSQSAQMSMVNDLTESANGQNANGLNASETSMFLSTEAQPYADMADIRSFVDQKVVQREPAAGEAMGSGVVPLESVDAPLNNPADGSEDEGESQSPDVDTDELARQVYAQLKRRLVVEQERIGRR